MKSVKSKKQLLAKSAIVALAMGATLSATAAVADQAVVVSNVIQMPAGVMQPVVHVDVYEQGQQASCASFAIGGQQVVISSGASHDCKSPISRLHYTVSDGPAGLMSAWFESGLSGDVHIENNIAGLMPQVTFTDAPSRGGIVPGTGAVPRGKIVAYVGGPYV